MQCSSQFCILFKGWCSLHNSAGKELCKLHQPLNSPEQKDPQYSLFGRLHQFICLFVLACTCLKLFAHMYLIFFGVISQRCVGRRLPCPDAGGAPNLGQHRVTGPCERGGRSFLKCCFQVEARAEQQTVMW
jgi:hypothetical protein